MSQFAFWGQDPSGETEKLPPLSSELSAWEAMFSILEWITDESSSAD